MSLSLLQLNTLSDREAQKAFLSCCHSIRWAKNMAGSRPYTSREQLFDTALNYWEKSSEDDILEAFSGHPKIGDIDAIKNKFASQAQAEQGQVLQTDRSVILKLKQLNDQYERTFGFIFIVCATGKLAEEMLVLLESRVNNSRSEELVNGAREQGKITHIRLSKLIESESE